jgi:hypothetical protein
MVEGGEQESVPMFVDSEQSVYCVAPENQNSETELGSDLCDDFAWWLLL